MQSKRTPASSIALGGVLAAVAVGACADAETARQLESGWTYEPNMQEKTIYDEVYTQYKTLTE